MPGCCSSRFSVERFQEKCAAVFRPEPRPIKEDSMRQLIAGNWKMNGLADSLGEIAALARACPSPACDILICPPATLIARAVALDSGIPIGGQDCHAEPCGAFTGDVSAEMLRDAGATAVILGHS